MSLSDDEKSDMLELFCNWKHADIVGPQKSSLLRIMNVTDRDALTANREYNEYFSCLEELLLAIENIQQDALPDKQVKRALTLLKAKKQLGDKELLGSLRKLITQKLLPGWPDKFKNAYKKGEEMIVEWIHLFVSYTNETVPGVNNSYKNMLVHELKEAIFQNNKEEMNLMASLISGYFAKQRLEAFYDKDKIYLGDKFEAKLDLYASKSFGFVQFIETGIFEKHPDNNYCYKEYCTYKKSITTFRRENNLPAIDPLIIFLVSNPEKKDPYRFEPVGEMEPQLVEWVKEIRDSQYKTIYANLSNEGLKLEIQKAAEQIMDYKKNFFRSFLDSIN